MELKKYIERLLHIEEDRSNKLVDLMSPDGKSFWLSDRGGQQCALRVQRIIAANYGKTATTVLRNSALTREESAAGGGFNILDYVDAFTGETDPATLENFKKASRLKLQALGNNSTFLSLGSITWNIADTRDKGLRQIVSPLIVVPIELIRSGGNNQPLSIKFVEDNIFFNPSFYARLQVERAAAFAQSFPVPKDADDIDLATFDLAEYFESVRKHIEGSDLVLSEQVAISKYDNPDICMYHDLVRNYDKLEAHPLVRAVFDRQRQSTATTKESFVPFILPYDSAQAEIIADVLSGANLAIKGPPGSGKTQTIANMVSALMHAGKRVLFVSKKISALTEVYNKLPPSLRNFALRMEYEREQDKIDIVEVHNELVTAHSYRSAVNPLQTVGLRNSASSAKSRAIEAFKRYKGLMCDADSFLNGSYFDLLDNYCRDIDIVPHRFTDPKLALALSYRRFVDLTNIVKGATKAFETMTDNYTVPAWLCIWLGLTPDRATPSTQNQAKALAERIETALQSLPDSLHGVDIQTLAVISALEIDQQSLSALLNVEDQMAKTLLQKSQSLAEDLVTHHELVSSMLAQNPSLLSLEIAPFEAGEFGNIRIGLVGALADRGRMFASLRRAAIGMTELRVLLNKHARLVSHIDECRQKAEVIFDNSVLDDVKQINALQKCYQAISKSKGELDKIAKKGFFKKGLALVRTPEFTSPKVFVDVLKEIMDFSKSANELLAVENEINMAFMGKVEPSFIGELNEFIEQSAMGDIATLCDFYDRLDARDESIMLAVSQLGIEPSQLTIGAIADIVSIVRKNAEFVALCADLGITAPSNVVRDAVRSADTLKALTNPIEAFAAIRQADKTAGFAALHSSMAEFFAQNYDFTYFQRLETIKIGSLGHFGKQACDRNYMAAALNYTELLTSASALDLPAFFAPFEKWERTDFDKHSLEAIFEHSVLALINDAVKEALGAKINECSRESISSALSEFRAAEQQLFEANAAITADLISSRIAHNSREYEFLKTKPLRGQPCRFYFKKYADQILKLKQCLIMSPSTISLLMRPETYECFDTVIIDEASQMPPEYILSGLYRAKQCVVVGDEYQMPPIKFFAKKTLKGDMNDEEMEFQSIESALALVLHSGAFEIRQLVSHYRSETETLIAYSQKEFYPDLITFPSVVPRRTFSDLRSYDLGLFDVHTPEGTSVGGQNMVEAVKSVEIVNQLFDRYYKTDRLTQSIGVIAFGVKQAELIADLILKDKELTDKITAAQNNSDGAPEKAFFIATVLTVQGMEADHIVMSVTYCRSPEGKRSTNYGALSLDSLGKQVFNVAVSRARRSIHCVHSLPSEQVAVEHVRNYLRLVSEFDQDDSSRQFVGSGKIGGFVADVTEFVVSLGIDRARIVNNYGVAENSQRIPIAILDPECKRAILGISCEQKVIADPERYIDRFVRYPDVLQARGWSLYPIYIFDWITNTKAEQERLQKQILAIK